MGIDVPKIEERMFDELLQEFRALVPYYTPEWRPGEDDGAGTALVKIYLHLMGNIHRQLNRLPEKHFISFLDRLGVKLRPPLPASVPITFVLSARAPKHVLIPGKTQVAAGDVIFETQNNILAAPTHIVKFYSVDVETDAVYAHDTGNTAQKTTPMELFKGENLQEHILYLGHGELFNIVDNASITLGFGMAGGGFSLLSDTEAVQWQYYGENQKTEGVTGWFDLDIDTATSDNYHTALLKNETGEITELEIDGTAGRWLRCRAKPAKIDALKEISIGTVEVEIKPLNPGVLPDILFSNSVAAAPENISVDTPLYPFGKTPSLHNTFYIGSHQVFSGKGPNIEMTFEFETYSPPGENNVVLSWEYWDGQVWNVLKDLADTTANFRQNGSVTFTRPGDFTPFSVNGKKNLWIRVRIIAGDYGRVKVVENPPGTWQTVDTDIKPPRITALTLSYTPGFFPLSQSLTYNNLEYIHRSKELEDPGKTFYPFLPLVEDPFRFYTAFDNKPEKGPVSLFFAVDEQPVSPEHIPVVSWEYYDEDNSWQRLDVSDHTMGLTRTGVMEFVFPTDMNAAAVFGAKHYWIRGTLVYREGVGSTTDGRVIPGITGMYLNTVWAQQVQSFTGEIVGSGDGSADQEFLLKHSPVISEEIWVNEIKTISAEEMTRLEEDDRYDTEKKIDKSGNVTEFWVRWQPVESLLASGADDRHYEIARVPGEITFGDGTHGKPVPTGTDNIKSDYRSGGGEQGNAAAFEVKDLKSSIPFLDKAYNPIASGGGADRETVEGVMERGPHVLKHRDRAVTAGDFEQLAALASASIARVKCLPDFDNLGQFRPGWVTVIVFPRSDEERPRLSLQMKQQVEEYLRARVSNVLTEKGRLQVWGPVYVEVSVHARLATTSVEVLPVVESEAHSRLRGYLNPLTGGSSGEGWQFGQSPCLSDFYALLESIEGVDHVEVSLTIAEEPIPPHAVICNGDHQIKVTWSP